MPGPVKIAFRSFSDIKNPETYAAPEEDLLQARCKTPADTEFNFTEWWDVEKCEEFGKPFDVGDELVAGLLRVLEKVTALFYTSDL